MSWWEIAMVTCAGSGVLDALLIVFDEIMTDQQLARSHNMNPWRSLDYNEYSRRAAWGFVLGLTVVPTIAAIFVTARPIWRFLLTGVYRHSRIRRIDPPA